MEITCSGSDGLYTIAQKILDFSGSIRVLIFRGEMGAGKTTLIYNIARCFGVYDSVFSPSYSIMNEYCTRDGKLVYHFDFYRVQTLAEALDTGFEEYLDSGNICLVEWPEKIEPYLPEHYTEINILVQDDHSRLYKIKKHVG